MIISTQFFPPFCVCLSSPSDSQPGVFSLIAIIDELMFPEPANVRPPFFWSLYGGVMNSRMAAFILEPVQFERRGLRGCAVSHWFLWGPAWVWRVTDQIPSVWFSCLLPECKFRDMKHIERFHSSFLVTRVPWQQILRLSPMGAVAEAAGWFDLF